ncbi:MAG: nuclear transport factor 2 family protein [Proteobacteria bacterium]|nr:nuclear transport factor 2 family protein [Pseudomonadota bacterium]
MIKTITTLFFLSGIFATTTAAQEGLTTAKLDSWLKGYEEAWESLDADKAAPLFTQDATYQDNPYEPAHQGREGIRQYWAGVTSDQQDVDFTYQVLSVVGNTGIAYWHSEFSSRSSGAGITLDGIFVLEFDQDGLCNSLKEWWHLKVDPAEGV